MTRACDFDLLAVGSRSIKPFEVGVDGSICPGDDHPTRLFSPCRRGDDRLEIHSCVEHLGSGHKGGLLNRQIGCKEKMKLRGVEKSKPICSRDHRGRLAEITWEALSVLRLTLSRIRHVSSNVHQSDNGWISSRFRNNGSPIAMCDKDGRSVLQCEDTLHGGDVILE